MLSLQEVAGDMLVYFLRANNLPAYSSPLHLLVPIMNPQFAQVTSGARAKNRAQYCAINSYGAVRLIQFY